MTEVFADEGPLKSAEAAGEATDGRDPLSLGLSLGAQTRGPNLGPRGGLCPENRIWVTTRLTLVIWVDQRGPQAGLRPLGSRPSGFGARTTASLDARRFPSSDLSSSFAALTQPQAQNAQTKDRRAQNAAQSKKPAGLQGCPVLWPVQCRRHYNVALAMLDPRHPLSNRLLKNSS